MGLFDNKNLNTQGFTIKRDNKDRIKEIDFDERDVGMTTAILVGIAKVLTAIFSKDKK